MNKRVDEQLYKLDEALRVLFTELDNYSESKLNQKPNPKGWSVFQVMHHLIRAEGYSLKYVQKKLSHNPTLTNAGILTQLRVTMAILYNHFPFKIKAPEAVAEGLPELSSFWETAKIWKSQRQELRNYLNEMPEDLFKKEIYKHPIFGRMTISGMIIFFEKHFERHQRQIYKTLKQVDAVKIK
jgi:hypothetical protein